MRDTGDSRSSAAQVRASPQLVRKRVGVDAPGLRPELLALIEPEVRGDPPSSLPLTARFTHALAAELSC
ncbi:hypothetical protein GCM10027590_62810 [Nocardiopsis nanhaiensis]